MRFPFVATLAIGSLGLSATGQVDAQSSVTEVRAALERTREI